MNKRIFCFLLALCLICSVSSTAFAIHFPDPNNSNSALNIGNVWFNTDGNSMGNSFQYLEAKDEAQMKARKADPTIKDVLDDRMESLQPGDDITFVVDLDNRYRQSTNWYMTSTIVDSLEFSSAQSGAYEYELWYINSKGEKTDIYSSERVGGLGRPGLESVNSILDEYAPDIRSYEHNGQKYFYLDQLDTGKGGRVYLNISLDGETQGNDYQDRLADLKMNFAVQVVDDTKRTTTNAPKTGDDNNLLPYYIVMFISGLLFLYLALDSYTDRLYKKGKGNR